MKVGRILRNLVISTITVVLCVAVGLSALLYFSQDRLIFLRPSAPISPPRAPGLAISEVNIAAADGLALRGWLARSSTAAQQRLPLAIYFGGNAEEVSYITGLASRIPGWSLLAVNYRGYGGNPGEPSERTLYADALSVYDWAANRADVAPTRIAAIGRSLGSGVAVYLAAERRLAKIVLVTPFDSLRAVAQHHYPYLPVSFLLRHPFDSIGRAPRISTPMLVIAAQKDSIVPSVHSRALFAQWRGPKTWREFSGADHNDLDADPEYWGTIAAYLADESLKLQ
ncbi:MAG: alpha/beta hydrolase [Verrucomicrobia bacterium]|nr:alpha/beta hydrolase [Verrucomicrobiota bacterium]